MIRSLPLLALLSCLACADKARGPEPLVLGEVGSLSGAEAAFGLSTRDGIALAVDEVNADGGVRGRPVVLRVYDSQSRPEEAAAAARRLVSQDKVLAILGEASSSASLAMAPVAQAAKVPMVSPTSTNPKVTAVGDYIFRACFLDEAQGGAMARYARMTLGLEQVAILTEVTSAYSEGLTEVFIRRFEALGGKVVARAAYSKGDTDFRAQLTKVKAAHPAGLYLPGYYQDVAAIAEQALELGVGARLLGSDGWSAPRLLELAPKALEGAVMTDSYAADDPAPASKAFIERFTARFGRPPNGNAALGYDAARLVMDAAARAATLDGPGVRDALAATRDFPGAAGTLTFDERRNPVKQVVLVGIEKGAFRFQATVAP